MEWKILSVLLIISLFLIFTYLENRDVKHTEITIKDIELKAEVADTLTKKKKGLMNRDKPPEAMIFVSNISYKQGIWMKNMNFAIDIIWTDENEIIDIERDAQPCKSIKCPIYYPEKPARYVIEVPANWTRDNNINVGDKVAIKNNF